MSQILFDFAIEPQNFLYSNYGNTCHLCGKQWPNETLLVINCHPLQPSWNGLCGFQFWSNKNA